MDMRLKSGALSFDGDAQQLQNISPILGLLPPANYPPDTTPRITTL